MPIAKRSKQVPSEHLNEFLDTFFAETIVNEDGSVSYEMWDFDHFLEILPDAFDLSSKLTARQKRKVVGKALMDCRKANEKSEDALLKKVEKFAKEKLSKPFKRFTMWMKFRATEMAFEKGFKFKWDGVNFRSASNLPNYLQLQDYFLSGHGQVEPDSPAFFGYLILSTMARDEDSAADKMFDALHVFYGLFNVHATWGQHSFHTGLHWTDGPLWLGPFQFVFDGHKFLGTDHLWYNPDYLSEAWTRSPLSMKKVLKWMPKVKEALAALEAHPLRTVLVRSLTLMQDGFAARDGSHRHLRYWSALEQLYGEDPNDRNQKNIIKRATFVEKSPNVERWRLSHAAKIRNDHVHAGEGINDKDASTQFLRQLMCRHLLHVILHRGDLANHRQWLELVDLPPTKKELEALKATIDKRLKYIK